MKYKAKRDCKFFDGKLVHRVTAGEVFEAEEVPEDQLDTNSIEYASNEEKPKKVKTKKAREEEVE